VTVVAAPALVCVVGEMYCGLRIVELVCEFIFSHSLPNAKHRICSAQPGLGRRCRRRIPFRLIFFENFALCMVTNDLNIYETTKIKPLSSELSHATNSDEGSIY
jgi:hypothetical protein